MSPAESCAEDLTLVLNRLVLGYGLAQAVYVAELAIPDLLADGPRDGHESRGVPPSNSSASWIRPAFDSGTSFAWPRTCVSLRAFLR